MSEDESPVKLRRSAKNIIQDSDEEGGQREAEKIDDEETQVCIYRMHSLLFLL